MTLFDYTPTDFPPDTAATGMPQVFGADVSFLFQAVLVLVVVGLVALWIGRKQRLPAPTETEAILQDPVWRSRLTASLEHVRRGETRPIEDYWAEPDLEDAETAMDAARRGRAVSSGSTLGAYRWWIGRRKV